MNKSRAIPPSSIFTFDYIRQIHMNIHASHPYQLLIDLNQFLIEISYLHTVGANDLTLTSSQS